MYQKALYENGAPVAKVYNLKEVLKVIKEGQRTKQVHIKHPFAAQASFLSSLELLFIAFSWTLTLQLDRERSVHSLCP